MRYCMRSFGSGSSGSGTNPSESWATPEVVKSSLPSSSSSSSSPAVRLAPINEATQCSSSSLDIAVASTESVGEVAVLDDQFSVSQSAASLYPPVLSGYRFLEGEDLIFMLGTNLSRVFLPVFMDRCPRRGVRTTFCCLGFHVLLSGRIPPKLPRPGPRCPPHICMSESYPSLDPSAHEWGKETITGN